MFFIELYLIFGILWAVLAFPIVYEKSTERIDQAVGFIINLVLWPIFLFWIISKVFHGNQDKEEKDL